MSDLILIVDDSLTVRMDLVDAFTEDDLLVAVMLWAALHFPNLALDGVLNATVTLTPKGGLMFKIRERTSPWCY